MRGETHSCRAALPDALCHRRSDAEPTHQRRRDDVVLHDDKLGARKPRTRCRMRLSQRGPHGTNAVPDGSPGLPTVRFAKIARFQYRESAEAQAPSSPLASTIPRNCGKSRSGNDRRPDLAVSRQVAYGHRKAKTRTPRRLRSIGDIRPCRGASSAAPPPPGRAGTVGAATARAAGSSLVPRKPESAHLDKRRG